MIRFLLGWAISCAGLLLPALVRAQDAAIVEQLAPVLAAEDARQWQPELFQRALLAPDSVVRRTAALAAGRIGDLRATRYLIQVLDQPDSTVRVAAAFALGLLRDSAAVEPLIQRLTGLPPLDTATASEAVTALARAGGRRSADFFAAVLQGKVKLSQVDPDPALSQILLETWRLGNNARAESLLPFADDTVPQIRWRALYSLGRLRAPAGANHLIASLQSDDPAVRAIGARALSREYADSAKLAPTTVQGLLARAIDDPDPGVRVNALRSLGTYHDSSFAAAAASKLNDADPNVRVQAAATVGELRGAVAVAALTRVLRGSGNFAVRREALLGLARLDPAGFSEASKTWRASRDWRERATAAEGWALARASDPAWFVSDQDGRVVAAGLGREGFRCRSGSGIGFPEPVEPPRWCGPQCGGRRPCSGRRSGRSPRLVSDVSASLTGFLSGCVALGPGRHPRHSAWWRRSEGRSRVSRRDAVACELPDQAVGRVELARGGCAMGTGVPDEDGAYGSGLPGVGAAVSGGPRLGRAAARFYRDPAARDSRDRAVRARCSAHGG
ncbi:MAG TPA: HEAT repeat domain-containing protein [Gemmatimonadales bacterium]|nr:HEAT repeat domain-containing protein [Gemmatimonadales bacterium]